MPATPEQPHKFVARLAPGWQRYCAICGAEADQHTAAVTERKAAR